METNNKAQCEFFPYKRFSCKSEEKNVNIWFQISMRKKRIFLLYLKSDLGCEESAIKSKPK